MRFNFKISRWANFYFFIQNLSEWHFSCRRDYNILWREELGSFTSKEESAIKQLKAIHSRYSFKESYLGQEFFLKKNPWNSLKKKLGKDDYINLQNNQTCRSKTLA